MEWDAAAAVGGVAGLAILVNDCKGRGNIQYTAGDMRAALASYSDALRHHVKHQFMIALAVEASLSIHAGSDEETMMMQQAEYTTERRLQSPPSDGSLWEMRTLFLAMQQLGSEKDEVAAKLFCNRAAVHIKLKQWQKADMNAQTAQMFAPRWLKPRFRWVSVLLAQGTLKSLHVASIQVNRACCNEDDTFDVSEADRKCLATLQQRVVSARQALGLDDAASMAPPLPPGWERSLAKPAEAAKAAEAAAEVAAAAAADPSCAKCGKSGDEVKLQRCSRCMGVFYCSQKCQKADWKEHKADCNSSSRIALPGIKSKLLLTPDLTCSAKFGCRFIEAACPAKETIAGCCFCCGRLIKNCGDNLGGRLGEDSFGVADPDGPFWVPDTFMPATSMEEWMLLLSHSDCPARYPAYSRLLKPGAQPDLMPGVGIMRHAARGLFEKMYSFEIAACSYCVRNFVQDYRKINPGGTGVSMDRHLQKCEAWLDVGAPERNALLNSAADLTIAERRAITLVRLFSDPDLSRGIDSTAGELNNQDDDKGGKKKKKKKTRKKKVSFSYKWLEAIAFPYLFPSESGTWSWLDINPDDGLVMELSNYTTMRLLSVCSRWREDSDYVCFALHRKMAANGNICSLGPSFGIERLNDPTFDPPQGKGMLTTHRFGASMHER